MRKLSQFFVNLEKESLLLSRGVEDSQEDRVEQIEAMLEQVYTDMNTGGRSVVVAGQNSLQLSVIELGNDPPQVFDHQVRDLHSALCTLH